jgi:hypothetical protein
MVYLVMNELCSGCLPLPDLSKITLITPGSESV